MLRYDYSMKDFPRRDALGLSILVALCICIYGQTLGYDFVTYDDDLYVLHPKNIGWWELSLKEKLLTPHIGYPIPLVAALYGVITKVFGLVPLVFHLSNVVIHLLNVGLFYSALRRINLRPLSAGLLVSAWASHPILAEPISWVTGTKELLLLTGALVALHGIISMRVKESRTWALLLVLGFLVGLGSKPTAVVLGPLLGVALLLMWRNGELERRRTMGGCLLASGLTILGVAHAVLTKSMHTEFGGHVVGPAFPRMVAAAHLQLQNLIFPLGLGPTYAFSPPSISGYVSFFGILLGASALFIWAYRRGRTSITFGLLWFAAFYFPMSNILPVSRFTADSYLYVPTLGLIFLLIPWLKEPTKGARSVMVLLVAFLALGSFYQSKIWTNGITLWERAVSMGGDEHKDFHYFKLGQAFALYENWPAAIVAYESADTELYGLGIPFDPRWPYAHWRVGDPARAERLFQLGRERIPPPRTQRQIDEWNDFNRFYQRFRSESDNDN